MVFDAVVIGIGHNPQKEAQSPLFTLEQRLRMARVSLAEYGDRVLVKEFNGATIDFAETVNATAIVRGIRNDPKGLLIRL